MTAPKAILFVAALLLEPAAPFLQAPVSAPSVVLTTTKKVHGAPSFVKEEKKEQRRRVLSIRFAYSTSTEYTGTDPWAELGIEKGTTGVALRRAYRSMAMKKHPDVNKSPEAAEEFKLVQAAYDLLNDPERLRKWQIKQRFSQGGGGARAGGAQSSYGGGPSWAPREEEYDDAGGDSFGAILGDLLRGFASAPKSSAKAVFEDLLDVLDKIPDVGGSAPQSFAGEREREKAEQDQSELVDKLDTMLRLSIIPGLATAKADEATARAKNDVEALLSAVERSAGLEAKKQACERQLKLARRELEAIRKASVGSSGRRQRNYEQRERPSEEPQQEQQQPEEERTSSRPPPREERTSRPPPREERSSRPPPREERRTGRGWEARQRAEERQRASSSDRRSSRGWSFERAPMSERVDSELDELKRAMGKTGGNDADDKDPTKKKRPPPRR